jgi:hypothetical protein
VVGRSEGTCKGNDNEYECTHAYTVIKEYMKGSGEGNKKIYSGRE